MPANPLLKIMRQLPSAGFFLLMAALLLSYESFAGTGDTRWMVYAKGVNNSNQIYRYDFQNRTNFLISRSFDSTVPANGISGRNHTRRGCR